jgi:hypothetical protein
VVYHPHHHLCPPSFANTTVSTHPPAQRVPTTSCIAPLPPYEQWLMAVVVGAFTVGCGGLQLPHPCPTPRAVAHEAGGGWCIVPAVICPPLPHCSPIWLLVPTIHPTSSCSWAWGQVLCHLCLHVIIFIIVSSLLLSCCLHHCCVIVVVPPLVIVQPLVHPPSTQQAVAC